MDRQRNVKIFHILDEKSRYIRTEFFSKIWLGHWAEGVLQTRLSIGCILGRFVKFIHKCVKTLHNTKM